MLRVSEEWGKLFLLFTFMGPLLSVALCVVCVLRGRNDKQHYKKDLSVACIPGALEEGKKKRCY